MKRQRAAWIPGRRGRAVEHGAIAAQPLRVVPAVSSPPSRPATGVRCPPSRGATLGNTTPSSLAASQCLAAIAVGTFLLVGLLTIDRYGYGDDEQWLMKRGELAAQIAEAVVHQRATPPIPKEHWAFHPTFYAVVNYHWVRPTLIRLGIDDIASGHILTLLMAAGCLAALFVLGRMVVGAPAALYSLLLLAFFPRFIAHAHYNPKDIPSMAFGVLSFVFVARWITSNRLWDAAWAGICLGLAASCHLNALAVVPVFVVVTWIQAVRARPGVPGASVFRLWAPPILLYAAVLVATLYVLWPLMWIRPAWLIQSLVTFAGAFETTEVVYFGYIYNRSAVPWHYSMFYILATTPVAVLWLMGAGLWRFKEGESPNRNVFHVMLLGWALIPVLIRLNPWVVKYNDIRHVFMSFPPLMIYAGWGLHILVAGFRRNLPTWSHRVTAAVASAASLAYLLSQILPIHPFEGDYFNEAFRTAYPSRIERRFDFPSWMTPYRAGLQWLNEHAEPGATIGVPHRLSVVGAYRKRSDLMFVSGGPANYVMVAGHNWKYGPAHSARTPAFEVRRYDSRLLAIFREQPLLPDANQ